jgi:hypothetical protein
LVEGVADSEARTDQSINDRRNRLNQVLFLRKKQHAEGAGNRESVRVGHSTAKGLIYEQYASLKLDRQRNCLSFSSVSFPAASYPVS